MAYAIGDRVKETTTTTGTTSPVNLGGAVSGYQTFVAGVGTTNQCNYTILSGNGTDWEDGIGTVTAGSPNTLSRTTVLASSNVVSGVPQLISLVSPSTVLIGFTAAQAMKLGGPIVPPPKASNWTQRSFGTTTLTDVANGLLLSDTATSTTVGSAKRWVTLAVPATPYTIDMNFAYFLGSHAASTAAYGELIVGWTDGTKYEGLEFYFPSTTTPTYAYGMAVDTAAWPTINGAGVAIGNTLSLAAANEIWVRLADNGTTVSYGAGTDGVSYNTFYSVAKASGSLGSSGYANIGFGLNAQQTGQTGLPNTATLRSWWPH